MPKFAANIGDNWLYSHIPFLDRIGAAAKDGFEAVECGNTHYNFDPNEIKKQLDKYNMKWVLLNTDSMPKYCNRKDGRKYHGIYEDEKELFKQTMIRAFDYSVVLNKEMCIHIDAGTLTKDVSMEQARTQFVQSLKMAQKILDDDKKGANKYKYNSFKLIIEPVNKKKGRGIENYYLWSQFEALSVIETVNKNYAGSYPIGLQFDFYHAQAHHGDIMKFLEDNLQCIQHIQVSQCPNRDEPCNEMDGDLNYSKLYKYLDKTLKYSYYVGLEYKPKEKKETSKGLRLDNDWFGRFNVTGNDETDNKEDK